MITALIFVRLARLEIDTIGPYFVFYAKRGFALQTRFRGSDQVSYPNWRMVAIKWRTNDLRFAAFEYYGVPSLLVVPISCFNAFNMKGWGVSIQDYDCEIAFPAFLWEVFPLCLF